MNQVEETTGYRGPFWLVNAGGKNDFTCKQWPHESFQAVIDHFQGRLTFVQIGAAEHNHRPLSGVIDLVGKTDHRQLIRLVYHSAGVLTGVSYPMHLAAALPVGGFPTPTLYPKPCSLFPTLRPCVVINGGREPAHWEQYPGHQFLHTIGALDCCATGGCWKSRVVPLGDGDAKDRDLCPQPIAGHPRCMRLITPDDVIRAIEKYLECGDSSPLSPIAERSSLSGVLGAVSPSHSVGNGVPSGPRGVPAGTASRKAVKTAAHANNERVLIDFRHGLGDAVQLTTLLLHLRHYHPDWEIDVAAGIGKLPGIGNREQGTGNRIARSSLYDRFYVRDHDPIDRGAYQQIFELAWDECPTCYPDSPSTKAEYCLRTVFNLKPVAELCRYELSVGDEAMEKAKAYLESICTQCSTAADSVAVTSDQRAATEQPRYPVVLLHYQGNTSTDKKDLPHDLARQVCETVIEAGYVPVILDWDRRSPLPDGMRIFNPGADHPLWGGIGTGDAEALAALIAQSSLLVGIDSGPLHVAGAQIIRHGATIQNPPVIAVWTGHHPLHYFGLAEHVTHLVPSAHPLLLRGRACRGVVYFHEHYRYRPYPQLAEALPEAIAGVLTKCQRTTPLQKPAPAPLRSTAYNENYYVEHKLAGLDYLEFGEWQRQYGRWLVGSLGLGGKRVLDAGCACGSIARGLREAGASVEGVDVCEAMVCRGRQRWPDMAAALHVCDAVHLHLFSPGVFDAIHTAQVAEHWRPDLVPFILRELARVTVPGGLLFCALDTEELFARQNRSIEREDPTHVCIRPMHWWHEQLATAGWQLCTADFEPALSGHPETFLTRYDWDWFLARRGRS